MNGKDLRTESTLETRSNDGNVKYGQGVPIPQCNQAKAYQGNVSNSLAKVDAHNSRPCAVIGPDRVVPPPNTNDAYLKKVQVNPWSSDNVYRRPPEYPTKVSDYQLPTRNISPRQTFQENMQRIMVPPTYSSVKSNETSNFQVDRNVSLPKNVKMNVSPEMKYCEVPYSINPMSSEHKSARNPDMSASNYNPVLTRIPHGWPPGNVRPPRPYIAPEHYQYQEFPSCAGPRPMPMVRPLRPHEESQVYPESYYQDGNLRFKPYQKERYVQSRYEYYPNTYHPPPPYPPLKYDLQKSAPPHSYPAHTQVPLKYLDRLASDPVMDGYQRPNQTPSYNISFRNQVVHPTYGPMPGNCLQNKLYNYSPEGPAKVNMLSNKPYIDYEQARSKGNPLAENYYANENMMRAHPLKNQMVMPTYSPINMHTMQPHPYYRKENTTLKGHEFYPHYRNMEPMMNPLARFPAQFSPNTLAISPAESNTSIDTIHNQGTLQEDCGYVSQSSTASARSIDSGNTRFMYDIYRRNDYRYGPVMRSSPTSQRTVLNSGNDKDKKNIDVRQFLQMWNESEDEADKNNSTKDKDVAQTVSSEPKSSQYEIVSNPEQLYVLGLVNVPSEELSKYEHIQKISKLPENIKGYNSIELLNQFEEAIEMSNVKNYNNTQHPRNFQMPFKPNNVKQTPNVLPRPVSPLDVEAKISQSVIHKEVGCNFEIKPCSPKMLSVEVAAPAQIVLNERVIEKVTNQVSPECDKSVNDEISSCKMVNNQYLNSIENLEKANYSLHDLESNPGVCFASLPRLDNDIELSFPEINQQFITANKVEKTQLAMKDLPVLEIEQSETDTFINNNSVSPNSDDSSNKNNSEDTESEFTKLSKFRKAKKIDLPSQEEPHAIRTDSVIIKNPENNRFNDEVAGNQSYEKLDYPAFDSQLVQVRPQSVSSPKEHSEINLEDSFPIVPTCPLGEAKSDEAIDFSINKTESDRDENVNFNEDLLCVHLPKISTLTSKISQDSTNNEQKVKEIVSCADISCKLTLDVDMSNKSKSTNCPQTDDIAELAHGYTTCEDFITSQQPKKNLGKGNVIQNDFSNADLPDKLLCENNHEKSLEDFDFHAESNLILTDSIAPINISLQAEMLSHDSCNYIQLQSTGENVKQPISLCGLSENHYVHIRLAKRLFSPWIQNLLLHSEGLCVYSPNPSNLLTQSLASESKEEKSTCLLSIKTPTYDTVQPKSDDVNKDNFLPDRDTYLKETKSTETDTNNENEYAINGNSEITLSATEVDNPEKDCIDCHENKNELLKSDVNLNSDMPRESVLENIRNNDDSDYLKLQNIKFESLPSKNVTTESSTKLEICQESVSLLNANNTTLLSSCFDSKITTDNVVSENVESMEQTNSVDAEINHDSNNILTDLNLSTNETINNESKNEIFSHSIESSNCRSPCDIENNADTQIYSNDTMSDESLSSVCLVSPMVNRNVSLGIEKDYVYSLDLHKTSRCLKRSVSDSALFGLKNNTDSKNSYVCPSKRKRLYEPSCFTEPPSLQVTQNNRRNSVASSFIDENVSFCILIENDCIIEESDEADRICLTKIDDSCFSKIHNTEIIERRTDVLLCDEQNNDNYSDPFVYEAPDDKSFEESWVEDVACVETVVSDDITEDVVIETRSSPNDIDLHLGDYDSEESEIFENTHQPCNRVEDIKCIYGNNLCDDDDNVLVRSLYRTPQINEYKALTVIKESHSGFSQYYDDLEAVLSEPNCTIPSPDHDKFQLRTSEIETNDFNTSTGSKEIKENVSFNLSDNDTELSYASNGNVESEQTHNIAEIESNDKTQFELECSSESRVDDVFPLDNDNCINHETRSPEVSSTTPEERNSSILLKITSYKGSRISQLKNYHSSKEYSSTSKKLKNEQDDPSPRPFITKAAQKYIPPLTDAVAISDLKVKLPLPQKSLDKLKQLKVSSSESRHKVKTSSNLRQLVPKKIKPKFEDILKSIDEVQIKKHKEKSKKLKKSVPMVVIKKNENGSHYASSLCKDNFNPDLTGRKWQPWVFIEKNTFIDKMAQRNKTSAVYNHRKNTYVLAENFRKYKAAASQFVISHPNVRESCPGLKYTIRLKQK